MVDIVVGNVTVPSVVGLSAETGSTTFDDVYLVADIVFVYRADVLDGTILSQGIAAGTDVAPGTIIRLVVANSARRRNMVTSRRTLLRVIRA
jgi:beta-lactam-binding protein with PASTA domain